jgi:hypothetical protein
MSEAANLHIYNVIDNAENGIPYPEVDGLVPATPSGIIEPKDTEKGLVIKNKFKLAIINTMNLPILTDEVNMDRN